MFDRIVDRNLFVECRQLCLELIDVVKELRRGLFVIAGTTVPLGDVLADICDEGPPFFLVTCVSKELCVRCSF